MVKQKKMQKNAEKKVQKKEFKDESDEDQVIIKEHDAQETSTLDAHASHEHSHGSSPEKRSNVAIIIAILLVLGGIAYFTFGRGEAVMSGDKVSLFYTGSLENGTIFDTNVVASAKKAQLYNEKRTYSPLEFVVGEGQVIRGMEEGVLGLRKGSTKKIVIPPKQAYGEHTPTAIVQVQRKRVSDLVQEIPRLQKTTRKEFASVFNKTLVEGKEYPLPGEKVSFKVIAVQKENVSLLQSIPKGTKLGLANVPWDGEVIGMNGSSILIKQVPPKEGVVDTGFGVALVTVNATHVIMSANVTVGQQLPLDGVPVRVVAVEEEVFYVDTNHPLAGKTLVFDVEVVDIVKKK